MYCTYLVCGVVALYREIRSQAYKDVSAHWAAQTWVDVLFVQAEDGIRDLVRSRGLGDVYKRQARR